MKAKTKIAYVDDNINPNSQGILAGVTEYSRDKGDWELIFWPDVSAPSLSFLKKKGCKGAFVRAQTYAKAKELVQLRIPIVVLAAMQETLELPFITADSEQLAKIAGDYLLRKRFRNFAFFGENRARWSQERMQHFSSYLNQAGYTVDIFREETVSAANAPTSYTRLWTSTTLEAGQQKATEWLQRLPKPVAALAACDMLGCHLSNLAAEAGFVIPDEIAVLGVDNDQAICNICDPPLSSIALNYRKAGYDAARLLDGIICGRQRMQGQCVKIQPTHVEARGSTDIFSIDDAEIVQALKYIRQRSNQPMQVEEIASHVCISKRSLQLKFQKALGRSIHTEIVQAHFEVARTLLLETNLSIDEIAIRSGFHYTSNMRRAFKQICGLLPQKYRQQHRPHYGTAGNRGRL
jgi:LacI family transcriptional regulator